MYMYNNIITHCITCSQYKFGHKIFCTHAWFIIISLYPMPFSKLATSGRQFSQMWPCFSHLSTGWVIMATIRYFHRYSHFTLYIHTVRVDVPSSNYVTRQWKLMSIHFVLQIRKVASRTQLNSSLLSERCFITSQATSHVDVCIILVFFNPVLSQHSLVDRTHTRKYY